MVPPEKPGVVEICFQNHGNKKGKEKNDQHNQASRLQQIEVFLPGYFASQFCLVNHTLQPFAHSKKGGECQEAKRAENPVNISFCLYSGKSPDGNAGRKKQELPGSYISGKGTVTVFFPLQEFYGNSEIY